MKRSNNNLIVFLLFILLLLVGTTGYMFLLQIDLIDAIYMTIITISTVGYGEVAEMTNQAKIFSIFIITWGVGTAGYIFTQILVTFVEMRFNNIWRQKRMRKEIKAMKNHIIVCGAGETGEVIIHELSKKQVDFIVIERNHERVEELLNQNIHAICGDATEEKTLLDANVLQARGLISTLSKDVDNVFAVLTSRQLNEKLYIISRAIDDNAPKKLLRAGADKTVSANKIGGRRMATMMLRPSVISFLDVNTDEGDLEFDLEDVIINENSDLIDKTLQKINIPQKTGLVLLAVQKCETKNIIFNPRAHEKLELGDMLMVLGNEKQVEKLRNMANDNGKR